MDNTRHNGERGHAGWRPPVGRRACLGLLAAGALSACEPATETVADQRTLRLAIDVWPGYFPAVLADALGWLAPAGVDLQVSFPGDTDRMLADFSAGLYDLIGASLGDLITITRGHLAAQVILVCDESAGGDAVLLRRGASLNSDGLLRIGTNLGGFGELFLREFLIRRHLTQRPWLWVNADAADVPRLLAIGELDVGHTWEPYVGQALSQGATRLFTSLETPALVADVLVTTRTVLQRRAGVVRAFVAQWMRAVDWWLAHPGEAAALIGERVHVPAQQVSLNGVRLLDLATNRRLLGVQGRGGELAPVVRRYSDYFLAKGSLSRPLDAATLLSATCLP